MDPTPCRVRLQSRDLPGKQDREGSGLGSHNKPHEAATVPHSWSMYHVLLLKLQLGQSGRWATNECLTGAAKSSIIFRPFEDSFPFPARPGGWREPHKEPQEIRPIYKFVQMPPAAGKSCENKLFSLLSIILPPPQIFFSWFGCQAGETPHGSLQKMKSCLFCLLLLKPLSSPTAERNTAKN